MRGRRLLLFILVSAASLGSQGAGAVSAEASLTEIFEAANVAASRGDYRSAVANYEVLVEAGVRDPDVYFNLATAYAHSGDYPRAILSYERSLTVRPGDDKAEENLRAAERALEEKRAEAEGEAMIQRSSSAGEAIYGRFPEDGLAYVLVAANVTLFGCLAWMWIARRRAPWIYTLLAASSIVFVFSAIGLGQKAGIFRDGPRAVALGDHVSLREGPYPQAQIRGQARGGDRGVAVDRDRDFVKLRLVDGLEGWAPASAVGLIDLDESVH